MKFCYPTSTPIWRALFLCILLPGMASGQDDKELAPVSRTYALTNATIFQAPGRKIEHGTVVLKDGLIVSAGKDAVVPTGAIVIKGDSLYIYAGFIDGLSHTGVVKPKDEPTRERAKDPGNPTPERAGITPQNDVRNYLSPTDKSVEEMRALGFTAAHVVPWGVYLPGNSAIVLLGGHSASAMVITPAAALYAELNTVQGAYPSTVIAGISKWHELYKQAASAQAYETLYASNRAGLERPVTDRILQAFYPVVEKKTPVLFKAEKLLDIHRVISLQSDLGFNLILANMKEGWSVADKVKKSGARVFLSIELPEEKSDDKKDDKNKKDKKEGDKKTEDKKSDEKKPEEKKPDLPKEAVKEIPKEKTAAEKEMEALEKRKTEFLELYAGQAAVYQKAGVPFGFSSFTVKVKDIPGNLRKIIKAGLTEDQALAALTTTPALLLGLSDRLGTIDNGKIANLVITDKPYFSEKAKVRYVFVEGELYKQEVKDAKKDGTDKKDTSDKKEVSKIEITGSWTFTTETPNGKNVNKIVFTKSGDSFSGTATGDRLEKSTSVKAVEVKTDHLKFLFSLEVEGSAVEVTVDGTLDGNSFRGTSDTQEYGSFSTVGVKDPGL